MSSFESFLSSRGSSMFSYTHSVFDLFPNAVTGVSACSEYGLCSGDDSYICYRVNLPIGFIGFHDNYKFFGDGLDYATEEIYGREYVSMFVAVYDALIMYTDDSAVEEILLELEYRGELEAFWSFALERGLSVSYKEYLEYLFLGGREVPVPERFY